MPIDFSTLLAAITGANQAAAQSDPWAPIASSGDLVGKSIIQGALQNPGQFSIGENLIGGLLSGLVSGGFNNLSRGYQDEQASLATDTLANLITGKAFNKPDEMAPSVYNKLKNVGTALTLDTALEGAAAKAKANSDQTQLLLGKYLENPQRTKYALEHLNQQQTAPQPTGAPVGATPATANAGTDMNALLDKYQGDEQAARMELERNIKMPEEIRTSEKDLRTQLLGQKAVQDFTELSKQYAALQQAINDPTAASDLDFAYGVAKILDPGSVVRQSESGMVIDSAGIPQALLGQINKNLNGGAGLGLPLRQALLALAQRRYDIQKGVVDSLSNSFGDLAIQAGGKKENVAIIPQAIPQQATVPQSITAPPPVAGVDIVQLAPGVIKRNGQTLYKQGNRWIPK